MEKIGVEELLDEQALTSYKLMATIKAVGEACVDLKEQPQPKIKTQKQADSIGGFSIMLGGFHSPYRELYTDEHYLHQVNYLKSLGYSGWVAGEAYRVVHDDGKYVSDLYHDDANRHHTGIIAAKRWADEENPYRRRSIAITVRDPEYLKQLVEKGEYPYERISRRAAVDLIFMLAQSNSSHA